MSMMIQPARFASPPPAATPLQYIVFTGGGAPVFINESAAADLQYVAPAAYVNEAG